MILSFLSCNSNYPIEGYEIEGYENFTSATVVIYNYDTCNKFYKITRLPVDKLNSNYIYVSDYASLEINKFPIYCKKFIIQKIKDKLHSIKYVSTKINKHNLEVFEELQLPDMRYLEIYGEFDKLPSPFLMPLISLDYSNYKKHIDFTFLKKMTNLEMLSISNTEFFDFTKLVYYKKLKYLIISGGYVNFYSEYLPLNNVIEYILLTNNSYENSDLESIVKKCPRLKKIILTEIKYYEYSIYKKFKNDNKFIFFSDLPEIGALLKDLIDPKIKNAYTGKLLNWNIPLKPKYKMGF